jgi:MATE family multidrug resistance protein
MSYFRERWKSQAGYREVLVLALPLILSTSAWTVQQFVDRMFLAWYSPEAIAASMPAGILNFAIMSLFMGTASYVGTFVAQYYGAGRHQRIGPAVWQGIYVGLLGAGVLMSLAPLAEGIFDLVGHDPAVRQGEADYFRVLCLGGGFALVGSAISGLFSGLGRPWPVMWVHTLATVVNIFFNYALIFGHWGFPELGIVGAGLATVISGFFAMVMFAVLALGPTARREYRTLAGWRFDGALFLRLLKYGLPVGVQFFLDMASFTIFVLLVGRLGMVSLAATNIAFNINMLAFMPMIGSGIAISVLVGQYLGRDRPDLAERTVYSGFHITLAYMATVAASYVLAPKVFIMPFAAQADPARFEEIFGITVILLRFVAVYSIFDTLNIVFSSAIKGAGDTRFVMLMMIVVSTLLLAVPTYLAIVVFGRGLMFAWVLVSINIMVLGLIFLLRFRGGKWKEMRVIERKPVL